jgi:hypothetical protein
LLAADQSPGRYLLRDALPEVSDASILQRMITRAIPLLCLVFSLPVSAQQPVAASGSLASRAFDPGSDAIKKIVRDSAATQSSLAHLSDSPLVQPAAICRIDLSVPLKIAAVKQSAPNRPAAPPDDDFLSALIGTLIEVGLDNLFEEKPQVWRACKPAGGETTAQISVMCPPTDFSPHTR